jgi:hypothetical protein
MKLTKPMWLIILTLWCTPLLAQKTDVVVLKNGDRITGEIQKMEAGMLEFSTDPMGTVYIEWRFIAEVLSNKQQTVETTDGNRWFGRLQKPEEGEGIELMTGGGSMEIKPEDVVQAWPVEATFWDKLNLDISAGMDYAKSTEIADFNFALDASYMTESRMTLVTARSSLTRQPEGEDQTRNTFSGIYQYFLPNRKFRAALGGLESNQALGVNLRIYAGGGIGRYFTKTNSIWFSGMLGLMASQENPQQASSETGIEGLAVLRHRYFRYASPERNLDSEFTLYPSISDFGRVRSDFRTTFKLELIKDLFWALEVYASYDSDPLSSDVDNTDYGITTSIGWSN